MRAERAYVCVRATAGPPRVQTWVRRMLVALAGTVETRALFAVRYVPLVEGRLPPPRQTGCCSPGPALRSAVDDDDDRSNAGVDATAAVGDACAGGGDGLAQQHGREQEEEREAAAVDAECRERGAASSRGVDTAKHVRP